MTAYDRAPSYIVKGDDVEVQADDAQQVFRDRHSGHPLTRLQMRGAVSSDQPAWDPMRVAYEEVSDGQETFLLKSWRSDVSQPRQYALLRGRLDTTATVRLPAEPLRAALNSCFGWETVQTSDLVERLQRRVARFAATSLIPAYCSADEPDLSYAYLTSSQVRELAKCGDRDGPLARDHLLTFLLRHQHEEALTLEILCHNHPRFR